MLLHFLFLFFVSVNVAMAITPQAGVYEYTGLVLGYDSATQELTGHFQSFTGRNQDFSCIFYFQGKVESDVVKIESWFPETPTEKISGTLTFSSPSKFVMKLTEDHGGCWNVMHFADDSQPAKFKLQTDYPWKKIRVIKSKKAFFHDAAEVSKKRKTYVVQGDGVGVKESKSGWLNVDFVGKKTISGWIQESDVF
jgi:hypothetical protein